MDNITLIELKTIIDKTMELHNNIVDNPVLITLSMPSIGGRKSCGVKCVNMGIDWEHGQFRIEPNKELVLKGSARDNVIKPIQREYSKRTYSSCGVCGQRVTKDARYCSHCGQRLK